ncbi:MAG: 5-methyltetrahydropteroyltriglutamate--homocysteine methyltransferase [Fimbriimonadaceae bacterium]|nr:5-methyltetrahydropteroyltriglutamate--homocysteine methyltransferase [Fimbriimonadaceae bacterium]
MVGSWPRSRELIQAQRAKQSGRSPRSVFDKLADQEVERVVRLQEELGVDILTDGELRRDNFYSFVAEKLGGVQLMTLSEMMEHVEDKEGFEELLQRLDVPAFAIRNPTCVGPISVLEPLVLDDYRFVRNLTDRPIKVTLPGPYILTRALWVPEVSQKAYPDKESLGQTVVDILSQELRALADLGVAFIQFDEPVLTELVFTQGKTRTFMCAALASRNDPAEELEWAVSMINQVADSIADRPSRPRLGVHVCRGNWSTREETLLVGNYAPLAPWFERLRVDQLVLEYATPRAGDLMPFGNKELGLGAVNPRIPEVESVEAVRHRIDEALQFWDRDRLFLNPDCGFATFSEREMNSEAVAAEKMRALAEAASHYR